MGHLYGCIVGEYIEFALSGMDGEVALVHHLCDIVAVQTGSVDDPRSLKVTLGGMYAVDLAIGNIHTGDLAVQHELDTVLRGVLSQRLHIQELIDLTVTGAVDTAQDLGVQHRLHVQNILRGQDLVVIDAVLEGTLGEGLGGRQLVGVQNGGDGAALHDRHIQIPADGHQHAVGDGTQPVFQRAHGHGGAGGEQAGVGLGGIAAHVIVLVAYSYLQLVFGKLSGDGAANGAGADNQYISFHVLLSPYCRLMADTSIAPVPRKFSSRTSPHLTGTVSVMVRTASAASMILSLGMGAVVRTGSIRLSLPVMRTEEVKVRLGSKHSSMA